MKLSDDSRVFLTAGQVAEALGELKAEVIKLVEEGRLSIQIEGGERDGAQLVFVDDHNLVGFLEASSDPSLG